MRKEFSDYRREFMMKTFPRLAFRINFPETSRNETLKVSELLKQRPELNFVAYYNHISFNDPFLAGYVVEQIDPSHSRHLVSPAAYSYSDPNHPKNKGYNLMLAEARRCGIEVIKVVQSHQIDNPEYGYTREMASEINQKWSERIEELGRNKTPTGVLISPEGHRSETGILGRAQGGIVSVGRKLSPAVFVPIGIVYTENFQRSGFNLNKHITLNVGQTIIQERPEDSPKLEQLIDNLAATLPPHLRGKWEL